MLMSWKVVRVKILPYNILKTLNVVRLRPHEKMVIDICGAKRFSRREGLAWNTTKNSLTFSKVKLNDARLMDLLSKMKTPTETHGKYSLRRDKDSVGMDMELCGQTGDILGCYRGQREPILHAVRNGDMVEVVLKIRTYKPHLVVRIALK